MQIANNDQDIRDIFHLLVGADEGKVSVTMAARMEPQKIQRGRGKKQRWAKKGGAH